MINHDQISEFKSTLLVGANAVVVGFLSLLKAEYLDFSDVTKGIIILGLAVLFEVITGLRAYYVMIKTGKKKRDKRKSLSTDIGVQEIINKVIAYTTALVLGALLSDWFKHPTFTILFLPEMNIVALVTMVGVILEIIQINKNFKNMGIDIFKTVKDFAIEAWKVFNTVKSGKSDNQD